MLLCGAGWYPAADCQSARVAEEQSAGRRRACVLTAAYSMTLQQQESYEEG